MMSIGKIGSPIGDRIKALRKKRGLSQVALAEASGLKQGSLSEFESGKYFPGGDTVAKLARALGVTTDYLLGTEDALKQLDAILDAPPPKQQKKVSREEILAAVQAVNENVERLRTELLSIRQQSEERAGQVVGLKKRQGRGVA